MQPAAPSAEGRATGGDVPELPDGWTLHHYTVRWPHARPEEEHSPSASAEESRRRSKGRIVLRRTPSSKLLARRLAEAPAIGAGDDMEQFAAMLEAAGTPGTATSPSPGLSPRGSFTGSPSEGNKLTVVGVAGTPDPRAGRVAVRLLSPPRLPAHSAAPSRAGSPGPEHGGGSFAAPPLARPGMRPGRERARRRSHSSEVTTEGVSAGPGAGRASQWGQSATAAVKEGAGGMLQGHDDVWDHSGRARVVRGGRTAGPKDAFRALPASPPVFRSGKRPGAARPEAADETWLLGAPGSPSHDDLTGYQDGAFSRVCGPAGDAAGPRAASRVEMEQRRGGLAAAETPPRPGAVGYSGHQRSLLPPRALVLAAESEGGSDAGATGAASCDTISPTGRGLGRRPSGGASWAEEVMAAAAGDGPTLGVAPAGSMESSMHDRLAVPRSTDSLPRSMTNRSTTSITAATGLAHPDGLGNDAVFERTLRQMARGHHRPSPSTGSVSSSAGGPRMPDHATIASLVEELPEPA